MFRNVLVLLLLLSNYLCVSSARPTYRKIIRHSAESKNTDGEVAYRREENARQVAPHYANQTQFSTEILHHVNLDRAGLSIRKATGTHAKTKHSKLSDIITRNTRSKKTHASEISWNNDLSDQGDDSDNENSWQNAKVVEAEDELLNRDINTQKSLKESLSRNNRASTNPTTRTFNLKNNFLKTVISHEQDAKRVGPIQAVVDEDIDKDAVPEDVATILLGNDKKYGNYSDDDKSFVNNLKKAAEISKALQATNALRNIPAAVISQKKSILSTDKIPANPNNQARGKKLKAERHFLKNLLINAGKMKKCKSLKITNMETDVYFTYKADHIKNITKLELDRGYTISNLKPLKYNTTNTKMALEIVLIRTYKIKAIYFGPGKDINGIQTNGIVTKATLQTQSTKTEDWKSIIDVNGLEKVYEVNNGVISLRKPHPLVAIRIYPQQWTGQPTFYKPKFVICV